MNGVLRSVAVAAALIATLAGTSRAADKTEIAFKFVNERKSTNSLSIDLDVTTGVLKAGRREESKTKTEMSMSMNATETAVDGGGATLAVTFDGLTLTQSISSPAGELAVEVSGSDVVVKRGGANLIDTKNDLGKDLATGLLAQFAFLGKEGTLAMGKTGAVERVSGPDEFTRFMTADLTSGLFVLRAPAEAVGAGESWSVEQPIARFRGLDLGASPVIAKTTFKLEGVREADGKRVATIGVKSTLKDNVDLSAKGVGGAFDGQTVLIPSLVRTATGTVEFNVDDGVVTSSSLEVDLSVKLTVTVDKQEVITTLTGKAKMESKRR